MKYVGSTMVTYTAVAAAAAATGTREGGKERKAVPCVLVLCAFLLYDQHQSSSTEWSYTTHCDHTSTCTVFQYYY